mmetsp:Transcript_6773/g.21620  ORF Transcript_6773/g.21620 Transcript_6773/m.21620 type:complete len:408 (-) Transcript_6773:139-1362(-)
MHSAGAERRGATPRPRRLARRNNGRGQAQSHDRKRPNCSWSREGGKCARQRQRAAGRAGRRRHEAARLQRVLRERLTQRRFELAESGVVRECVAREARARDGVVPVRLLGDEHSHRHVATARGDDDALATRKPLCELVLRVDPGQGVAHAVSEVLRLEHKLIPAEPPHHRLRRWRLRRRLQGVLAVRLVDCGLGERERGEGRIEAAPAAVVQRRAAELRRCERHHLAHVVAIVLQVGDVELQLAAVQQRRDGEHVPKGWPALAAAVVNHCDLARPLLLERARDGRHDGRVGSLSLREARVAAHRLAVREAAHVLPRPSDPHDWVALSPRVGDDDALLVGVDRAQELGHQPTLQCVQLCLRVQHKMRIFCITAARRPSLCTLAAVPAASATGELGGIERGPLFACHVL